MTVAAAGTRGDVSLFVLLPDTRMCVFLTVSPFPHVMFASAHPSAQSVQALFWEGNVEPLARDSFYRPITCYVVGRRRTMLYVTLL